MGDLQKTEQNFRKTILFFLNLPTVGGILTSLFAFIPCVIISLFVDVEIRSSKWFLIICAFISIPWIIFLEKRWNILPVLPFIPIPIKYIVVIAILYIAIFE